MKTLFIAVLLTAGATIYTQQLSVKIEADKTEIKNTSFSSNIDDHLFIRYVLYNISKDTVKVKFEPYFDLEYLPSDVAYYNNCFRLFPVDSSGGFNKYVYDTFNSFVTIVPGDSAVGKNYFTVVWPCRSMPPAGDWNFNVKYRSTLSEEKNFYLINNRYTDSQSKEYVKAWIGELSSNTINLKVTRE